VALRERAEDVKASRVRVGEAVTSKLDAYEHYFRGGQLAAAEKVTEALDAYRRAVQIDPEFPQAHLAIASLLRVVDPEQSNRALAEALRHVDRLPEKERLLVRAEEAGLGFRTEEALGLLDRVRERWPEDPEGHWLAGSLLASQRGDFDRGLPLLERAAALDPSRGLSVIRVQLLGGRLDDALQTARRFAEQRPGPESLGLRTIVHSARGEEGPALEAARRAVQAGAAPTLHVLHAYLRAGALAEAEALVRARMTPGTPALERRDAFINLAVLQGVQGRMREGQRTLDAAARQVDGGKPSPYLSWARAFFLGGTGDADGIYAASRAQVRGGFGGQVCNAVLLADLGQAKRAEEMLRGYAETPCAAIVRAVGDFRQGRREEALSALERLRFPMARYYQGKLLVEVRRDAEVVLALHAFQNGMTSWLPFFAWAYPESLYLSAVALERRGDLEPARQEVGRLLALWSGADPGLPLIAKARALASRLRKTAPGPAGAGRTPPEPAVEGPR
jgi:eukaryotic-like serine/threonine-protein kinase